MEDGLKKKADNEQNINIHFYHKCVYNLTGMENI